MRKAKAIAGLAALACALALPAHAQESSEYHDPGPGRGAAADNIFHAAALDPADQALAQRVVDALSRDKKLHNVPVTVAVNHGDVTLIGPTDNQQVVSHIEHVAASVAGRRHVFPMV